MPSVPTFCAFFARPMASSQPPRSASACRAPPCSTRCAGWASARRRYDGQTATRSRTRTAGVEPQASNGLFRVEKEKTMATVMVVDDDRVILQLCSQTVEAGGMDVLQAADGNEAIHVAGRYSGAIDLLLSDVVMPGAIHGVRLAEILTSSRPAMKELLMSGSRNERLT